MQKHEVARPHPARAADDKVLEICFRLAPARKPGMRPQGAASMGYRAT